MNKNKSDTYTMHKFTEAIEFPISTDLSLPLSPKSPNVAL